jgi:acyl carrier protein
MLKVLTPVQLEALVLGKIRAVMEERSGEVHVIKGTDGLNATLGLSSLDLALIVAELEVDVGTDPFAKLVSITSVRSVNDLVGAYRKALFPETSDPGQDHDLAAAVRRAQTRQARKAPK